MSDYRSDEPGVGGDSIARSAFRQGQARDAATRLRWPGERVSASGSAGRRPTGHPAAAAGRRADLPGTRGTGGGAMKFGQLSLSSPCCPTTWQLRRAHLARLRTAPLMPTSGYGRVLAHELGRDWRGRFRTVDRLLAAAASIGQVHKGIWSDGSEVAIMCSIRARRGPAPDLRQIGRMSKMFAPLAGGMDVGRSSTNSPSESARSWTTPLRPPSSRRPRASTAIRSSACRTCSRPHRRSWSRVDRGRLTRQRCRLADAERNAVALRYVRFLFAGPSIVGLLHADPHPGNFKISGRRAPGVDFGWSPNCPMVAGGDGPDPGSR
jgi:hypothetical protein